MYNSRVVTVHFFLLMILFFSLFVLGVAVGLFVVEYKAVDRAGAGRDGKQLLHCLDFMC